MSYKSTALTAPPPHARVAAELCMPGCVNCHCKHSLKALPLQALFESTMYKAVLALAASAGAFAPSVHQRATLVQQGVPLANGAMEFDRMQPASA